MRALYDGEQLDASLTVLPQKEGRERLLDALLS